MLVPHRVGVGVGVGWEWGWGWECAGLATCDINANGTTGRIYVLNVVFMGVGLFWLSAIDVQLDLESNR